MNGKGKGNRKEDKIRRKEDDRKGRVKGNRKRVSLRDLKGEGLGGEVVVSEGDNSEE